MRSPTRPFKRIDVLYDPESLFPLGSAITTGPPDGGDGVPPLAERYTYEDLVLDAPLTADDFDPANPAYEFLRY